MAEINQAIGATGVVSNECKMVVKQYGDQIVEMLLAQVNGFIFLGNVFVERRCRKHLEMLSAITSSSLMPSLITSLQFR